MYFLLSLTAHWAACQSNITILNLERYNSRSYDLIAEIQENSHTLLRDQKEYLECFEMSVDLIKGQILDDIKAEKYIKHDSLESLLNEIAMELMFESGSHVPNPVFLIKADPLANATAYLINVFEFDFGIFLAAKNREELAFIIGHVLAHQVLQHAASRVIESYKNQYIKVSDYGISPDYQGKERETENEKIIYNALHNSTRENEIEADSLTLVYLERVGIQASSILSVMNRLGYNMYTSNISFNILARQLFTSTYPSRHRWYTPRIGHTERLPNLPININTDFILSHPNNEYRKSQMDLLVPQDTMEISPYHLDTLLEDPLVFTLLDVAFESKNYEVAMFLALHLRLKYPENDWLVSLITQMFINLQQAQKDHNSYNNFYQYVHYNPYGLTHSLKEINVFFFNLKPEEMLEIAIHFLNNEHTFNPEYEQHYHLLMQIARKTGRESMFQSVSTMYLQRFPNGKYAMELK